MTLVALFLAQLHVCSMQMGSWSQVSHLLANGRPTQTVHWHLDPTAKTETVYGTEKRNTLVPPGLVWYK